MLYIQLCVVENQVACIKAAAPPFVSSAQLLVSTFFCTLFLVPPAEHTLEDNIKSFVVAVLLSSKLSAYKKESVPVEHVMVCFYAVLTQEQP
jgi:hypothetical protein